MVYGCYSLKKRQTFGVSEQCLAWLVLHIAGYATTTFDIQKFEDGDLYEPELANAIQKTFDYCHYHGYGPALPIEFTA